MDPGPACSFLQHLASIWLLRLGAGPPAPPPSGDAALHLGFTALRPLRALLGATECVSSGRNGR